MRILFVTGEYPPQHGGVGAYTAQLARALRAQGVQVSVLTSTPDSPQISTIGQSETVDNSKVAVYREVGRWGPGIWRTIRRRAAALGAEWIHVQYQTAAFRMNPAISFPPRPPHSGPRIAWTYHDLLVPYLFPKAGARLRTWVTERPALTVDQVIVTNEADRLRLAGRVPRLESIPIGSNIEGVLLTPDERAALRRSWSFGDGQALIGYFGFLNRSKGGLTLVWTLHALVTRGVDAHLLMVGERLGASDPTNAAYLAEVEALIATLGLTERVRWTGHLDDAAAGAALNAVDLLLLPYADGASLRRGTLMAGLANGCAIVTTPPQIPIPELVEGRDLVYLPMAEIDAGASNGATAASAVAAILADPARRTALRAEARARSALFTWESIARRHLALYQGGYPPGW